MRAARRVFGRPVVVAALVCAVFSSVVLTSCSDPGGPSATVRQVGGPSETSSAYPGAFVFPHGYAKPDVMLTDTSGSPFDIATDTAGQVTLVYFGYTHCPDLCPLNMYTTATAIQGLPRGERGRVHVVFVTTDPLRDTPSVIRTWLDHFDPSFIGLTGPAGQIARAELATGIPLSSAEHVRAPGANYQVNHAGYVLAYTPDGRAHLEFPAEILPGQEARDLSALLARGWQR